MVGEIELSFIKFMHVRAMHTHADENDPWDQFHNYLASSFCGSRFTLILLAHFQERKAEKLDVSFGVICILLKLGTVLLVKLITPN